MDTNVGNKNTVDNITPPQRPSETLEIPFLDELLSLTLDRPIRSLKEYNEELTPYELSMESLFVDLIKLSQRWKPRMHKIPNPYELIKYMYTYIKYLDKLLNSNTLNPEINGLIRKIRSDFLELESSILSLRTKYFPGRMPKPFELFNTFKTPSQTVDAVHMNLDLFHILRLILITCKCRLLLDPKFAELKQTIDNIRRITNINQDIIHSIDETHCNVEKWIKQVKELESDVLPFQVLYSSIGFLLINLNKEAIKTYKEVHKGLETHMEKQKPKMKEPKLKAHIKPQKHQMDIEEQKPETSMEEDVDFELIDMDDDEYRKTLEERGWMEWLLGMLRSGLNSISS